MYQKCEKMMMKKGVCANKKQIEEDRLIIAAEYQSIPEAHNAVGSCPPKLRTRCGLFCSCRPLLTVRGHAQTRNFGHGEQLIDALGDLPPPTSSTVLELEQSRKPFVNHLCCTGRRQPVEVSRVSVRRRRCWLLWGSGGVEID
jgi:hypothetical protein